ncbi:MAG: hypothetical protein J0M30_02635 [Chitinophagales bacterium]|nr:hypothetical protein [Chitinophagales bacterium]
MNRRPPFYLLVSLSSLFLTFPFIGCLDLAGSCETEVWRRIPNPDNNVQAINTITDCGATTSPSYAVRIIETSDTIAKGDRENTIFVSNKRIDIKWVSKDTLLITGADTTNGFTMKHSLKLKKSNTEIKILYNK